MSLMENGTCFERKEYAMTQNQWPIFIEPLRDTHLFQVQLLINRHLGTIVPGWALPVAFIASNLQRNPRENILDPWVRERVTLCALQRQYVVAAAHLLRYGNGPEVGQWYQNVGDLAWFLAWPDANEAAAALLAAARRQFVAWEVTREYAWDAGLPVGPFVGVPDVWPHIASTLEMAGYHPRIDKEGEEIIYGGPLDLALPETSLPVAGLALRRTTSTILSTRFVALVYGVVVGQCECETDLTQGGTLPALRGWGDLSELEVKVAWRNRGIGTWLVRQAVAWHRLGGGERMILPVTPGDEDAGAGRLYQRLGWQVFVRQRKGWQWVESQIAAATGTP
jgi:GNAT superfamily N-acetyltransferase